MRPLVPLSIGLLVALTAPAKPACAAPSDGIYGRLDGDLDLRLGAGASFAQGGPSLAATASALYLSTAGAYAHYSDSLGSSGPAISRSIAFGVHLEPVFLARFALDLEQGPAHLDLLADSFALQLGTFWEAPRDHPFSPMPGLEFAAAFGIPVLPQASGPWVTVRGALRFRPADLGATNGPFLIERSGMVSVAVAWRQIIPVHLVDAADRTPR